MTIGADFRVVWVATVPRTGSMWTYNITRDVLRTAGHNVLPEIVPSADEEMERIGRAGITAGDGTYVVKVHTRIPADLEKSLYIVTRRDVRDSLVSFMRFSKVDFEAGLRFVAAAIRKDRHFATFPDDRTLRLEYLDILSRPEWVVQRIAERLGIRLEPAVPAELVARYSKEKVQARLIEREQALREKIAKQEPVDVREFVAPPNRPLRAFDTSTGFQSGHVSSYEEGDWKHILTPDQQRQVDELQAYLMARQESDRSGG